MFNQRKSVSEVESYDISRVMLELCMREERNALQRHGRQQMKCAWLHPAKK